ncbi:zinc finger MYM-type protein 1-like [Aphis craccivora]|uniref:Zinc finger MYM-type protein 1-like n=1 Tax=Aphis craccivora TaxID=307492 RepID=A0A6G0Y2I4_APHCR|nr:zinc finger MYM-type protein 1-like [Aphis craccivora]
MSPAVVSAILVISPVQVNNNQQISVQAHYDVGLYINSYSKLSDEMKFNVLTQPFIPTNNNYNFKNDRINEKRCFKIEWLKLYSWLVYSKHLKGGFANTVIFRPVVKRGLLGSFIVKEFTNKNETESYSNQLSFVDLLSHCEFYPAVLNILTIFLSLPPTTCTIERSFSTLRRVKTWLRSTISEERLSGLYFAMYESVTLSLTGNATILSVNYFPSINLYENSEIALLCLQSFNLFPDFNENNNTFSIEIVDNENNNASMMCYIKLEEGCYEIEDINQRVKKQIDVYNNENLTKLTFDISVDPNDFRSYIKYNGILHFEIPFSMAPVFDFEKRQCKPEYAIHRSKKALKDHSTTIFKVIRFMSFSRVGGQDVSNQFRSVRINYERYPLGSSVGEQSPGKRETRIRVP